MGMLFNTPTTLQALGMVNNAFRPDKFQKFQTALSAAHPPTWATDLYNAFSALSTATAGTGNIFQVANMHPLYLDFDRSSQPGIDASTNWKLWLGFLDSNGNGTISWSAVIAQEIARAAKDSHCKSIEYFAVPDKNITVVVSYLTITGNLSMTVPASNYTSIITVHTNTVDFLVNFFKRKRKKKH